MNELDKLKMQFVKTAINANTPQEIQDAVYSLESGAWGKIADFIIAYCDERGIDKHAPEIAAFYQEAEESRAREAREQKEKAAADLAGQIANYQENLAAGVKLDDPGLVERVQSIEKIAAALGAAPSKNHIYTMANYFNDCKGDDPAKIFRPQLFYGLECPPGTVSYIGGRAGGGKTSAMINLAREAIRTPRKVLFITLEMSGKQILNKLIHCMGYDKALADGRNDGLLRRGASRNAEGRNLNPDLYNIIKGKNIDYNSGNEEYITYIPPALNEVAAAINDGIFTLWDGHGITDLKIITNTIKSSGEGCIVLLDYIQRLPAEENFTDTYMRIKKISDAVVTAAINSGAIIISGAQLNRTAASTNKKDMSNADNIAATFRESGDLEQDAHNLLVIYTDKEEDFVLHLLKTRETGGKDTRYRIDMAGAYSHMVNMGIKTRAPKPTKPDQSGQKEQFTGGKIL
jgi:hypothetical protein